MALGRFSQMLTTNAISQLKPLGGGTMHCYVASAYTSAVGENCELHGYNGKL
jgi:hypothetical protein